MDVGSNAWAGEIGVAASFDQVWEVLTDCDWITIVSGRSGLGNGKVLYQFTDNTTGETRTCTIIIGGQEYTLTQRITCRSEWQSGDLKPAGLKGRHGIDTGDPRVLPLDPRAVDFKHCAETPQSISHITFGSLSPTAFRACECCFRG